MTSGGDFRRACLALLCSLSFLAVPVESRNVVFGGLLSGIAEARVSKASGKETTAGNTCPPVVSECDFYFVGYETVLPTFDPSSVAPDTPFTPAITSAIQPSSAKVSSVNSGNVEFICADGLPMAQSDQFYASGQYIRARASQSENPFSGMYVKVPLAGIQLAAFGMTFNLNPGQGVNFFPDSRRCVVFKLK